MQNVYLHFCQRENERLCGRCSEMCSHTLFSWRPLLSFCCGLLVGSIPVQDDIIVQAKGRKYCKNITGMHIYRLSFSTEFQKDQADMCHILQSCYSQFGFFSPLYLALPNIQICDRCVVYLLAEAEHGYASMPPFISSRERESLKRKSKSKKNTSSR